jgi:hypothetical protein
MTHSRKCNAENTAKDTVFTAVMKCFCVTLLLVLSWVSATRAWAQGAQGTIVGTVKDSAGAVVPNVPVTVTNTATNVSVVTKTTQVGDFNAPYLSPGAYRVTVEATGFQTAEVTGIILQVGLTARADVVLRPGSASQTISVEANPVAIQTESAAVGTVITERQILDLPLDNRSFGNLMILEAGATTTNVPNTTVLSGQIYNISGARAASVGYLLDGMTNTEPYYSVPIVALSLDAIQEFKEQNGQYSAEYGSSAAQINVSIKSGTNDLHGTVYEFIRNNAFDALSAFTPPDTPVPPLHQNDYGFAVGGPVYIPKLYNGRNKAFFFADYERLVSSTSSVNYGVTPTNAYLQGTIAPDPSGTPILDPMTGQPFAQDNSGNYVIPKSRWARLALVANAVPGRYFPIPGSTDSNGNNFVVTITNPNIYNQQTYKFNQIFGSKDSLSEQFSLVNAPSNQNGITLYANESEGVRNQMFNVIETHTFTPHLINQARVGWTAYNYFELGQPAPQNDVAALGLQNTYPQSAALQFPNISITDFYGFGGTFGLPDTWGSSIWNGEDSMNWTHGKHNVTFGFLAYVNNGRSNNIDNQLGTYDFDGVYTAPAGMTPTAGNAWADYLLGDLSGGQTSLPTSYLSQHGTPPPWYLNQMKFPAYIEDDWKATSRLTLNLGVRYDYEQVPQEQHPIWPVLTTPGGIVCTSDKEVIASGVGGSFFQQCKHNSPKGTFAPRLGFAWRPFKDDKTVVRGGYGIFFDQLWVFEYDSSSNFPWVTTFGSTGYNFNNLFPVIPTQANSVVLDAIDHPEPTTATSPYMQDWSIGVQRELAKNTVLDVTYMGDMGTHLFEPLQANEPNGYNPNDTPEQRIARYPYYNFGTYGLNGTPLSPGSILSGVNTSASNYNSLQVTVNHRAKDLVLLAAFTWSSAMDDMSSPGGTGNDNASWQGPMDSHNIHLDYSKSSFDVNRRFVGSFVYPLPFGRGRHFANGINAATDALIGGWQANGIYSIQTGIPYNVAASDIGAVLQTDDQRGDLVGKAFPSGFHKTANEWFNVNAYAQPAQGMFGTEHRNDMRAAGLDNLDFSLFKDFSVWDRVTMQFRGESFNAFNHTDLASPNRTVGSSNIGTITGVDIPGRIVQLGLKVKF